MNAHSKPHPSDNSPTGKTVPHDKGLPIFGHTFGILKDPVAWGERMFEKHGEVFRYNAFFQDNYMLTGLDALEMVWTDKDQSFSTQLGYQPFLSGLTETSLLLMDFDKHRKTRQSLNPAFKAGVMKLYLEQMQVAIKDRIKAWGRQGQFLFYPAVKQLTLDVATAAFLGIGESKERSEINEALTHIFGALVSPIRLPIPGTSYWKGIRALKYLEAFLLKEIQQRKGQQGTDVFTRLCNEISVDGVPLSDDEIIGHLITFWVAGHDTLASSLSTLIYHLGKYPEWQSRIRDEVVSADLGTDIPNISALNELKLCDYAFREALRIQPPILSTPRKTLKDITYRGFHVPKGKLISESILGAHHDPNIWPEPLKFDPTRFAPENTPKDRPKNAWAPFGGGAHKCIGMIFAQIQAKVFLVNLLRGYRIELEEGYEWDIQLLPTPRPKDGLPVTLSEL